MEDKHIELIDGIALRICESTEIGELVLSIVKVAFKKFEKAGAADDFVLQSIGPGKIVFGSTNRVSWSAARGFEPDESYCTKRFLHAWKFGVKLPADGAVSKPRCGQCGATDVRIYRQYGTFRQPHTDRCNECVDRERRGFMVPLVLDANGKAWGYTSAPADACEEFYALPEKSSEHPGWKRLGGWPDAD